MHLCIDIFVLFSLLIVTCGKFHTQKQSDLLRSRETITLHWKLGRAIGIYTHLATTISHSAGSNYY